MSSQKETSVVRISRMTNVTNHHVGYTRVQYGTFTSSSPRGIGNAWHEYNYPEFISGQVATQSAFISLWGTVALNLTSAELDTLRSFHM
jgi:hypothetical protein